MIKAHHKKIWEWFFVLYAKFHHCSLFKEIRFRDMSVEPGSNLKKGEALSAGKPVILISNHFSFWDGFIHIIMNRALFRRKIHIMMLYEQLIKHKFLRYGGTFSIDKGRKGVVESLKYSCEILKDCNNMLLIFPQGKIQSIYTFPFRFEKGVEYIISNSKDIDIYFNINLLNFFSDKKPTLTMYYKHFISNNFKIEDIEQAYNLFSQQCMEQERGEL
ncbi:MAG: hypothetical protein A2266_06125 [Bacteroidetes bacterium RIFOXYA12_FULL_40_10]|nr:MAG: hypothetical protein A2266_06125 [Bacteroidetes bacterium RIFOXYA12_FULL_40_10]